MNDGATVLVVDDDDAVRLLIARLLQRQQHKVTTAADGQQAWQLLHEQPFDLVLLDVVMPGLSGPKLLAQIKADSTLAPIPVLMVSAVEDTEAIAHCLELGAEDYLVKPPNSTLLKARVEACLARKSLRDRASADLKQLQVEKAGAESASQAKSQFLANMSHELRTPLNAIIGYSEMIQEDLLAADQADLLPDLQKIHTAGNHLLALVSDILDLSKLDAGKMLMACEPIEVAVLVADLARLIQPTVAANHNTLTIECPADIGTIESDPSKIKRILLNLLSNATKFTVGGAITLAVKRRDDDLVFQVRDTGIGIAPEQQQRIFHVFTQADESSTRKYGGTGLGLAISQRLSHLLGGSLSVESAIHQGATFTLSLPIASPAEIPPPILTLPTPEPRRALIMAVTGDRTLRDQLVQTLHPRGFRVVTAWCAPEGMRLVGELRPDAIVLDVSLPLPSSWVLLAQLKSDSIYSQIPILLVASTAAGGLVLGWFECLRQPVDPQRLLSLLSRPAQTNTVLLFQVEQTACQRALQAAGWKVLTATTQSAALKLLHDQSPDLVMVDWHLPVTDWLLPTQLSVPLINVLPLMLTPAESLRLAQGIQSLLSRADSRVDLLQRIDRSIAELMRKP